MIILKESFVDTSEKVYVKSIHSFYVNPLATSHILYLFTLPFESFFVLNIHLQPIYFTLSGKRDDIPDFYCHTLTLFLHTWLWSICENSHFLKPDGE
jgi:hypothetical protein